MEKFAKRIRKEGCMMTRYLIVIAAVLSIIILPYIQPILTTAEAGDRQDIELLMQTFFDSLSSGDTDGILSCLTEPMLSQRKELLLYNPNYPNLLRKVYQHVKIDFGELKVIDDNTVSIAVKITKSNNNIRNTTFICTKVSGSWKISQEISIN